jgi:spore germination cell wall hydrolase CwlJ-like protein
MKFLLIRTFVVLLSLSFLPLLANPLTNNPLYEISHEFNKQLLCMARNIYYEAGREPYEGKLAVAQVVNNRVNSSKFPKTICEVVYQKINNTYQFSWVGENVSTQMNKYVWEESLMVAKKSMTNSNIHELLSKTKAMYFHAVSVSPDWNLKRVTKIGNHIFYASK